MEKWKIKLKALFDAYGTVAIGTLIAINVLVIAGAAFAINRGWKPDSIAGTAGTWVGAYVIYKATTIPRWLLAVALTPLVARAIGRKPRLPPPVDGGAGGELKPPA
jgi:hypothetical protein